MRILQNDLTIQVFADHKHATKPVYPGQKHGTLAEHKRFLHYINRRGGGIYFTVNQTDGSGRKTENITRIRAYFIDCDGLHTSAAKNARIERIYASGLPPSAIVETRNGVHAYWYSHGDEPADPHAYRLINRRLAHHYGGDMGATDIARVLRIPGFLHQKDPNTPFVVKLLFEDPNLVYTPQQLLEVYPAIPDERTEPINDNTPIRLSAGNSATAHAYLSAALTNQAALVRDASEGKRNETLNRAAYSLGQLTTLDGYDTDTIQNTLLAAALDAGLNDHEARSTIRSGLKAGMKRPRAITLNTQEVAA